MSYFNQAEYKIIMGLGNPGPKYDRTRHNVGFEVIDALAKKYEIELFEEKKFTAVIGKKNVQINGKEETVILVKPMTFMNDSGIAASKVLNWQKLGAFNLLVIHDEVAIDLGKIRVNYGRGAGGHHGIESIMNHVGSDFSRIRIGVGPDPGGDLRADYVLGKFNNKDYELFNKVIDVTIEAAEMLCFNTVEEVMNKFNGFEVTK